MFNSSFDSLHSYTTSHQLKPGLMRCQGLTQLHQRLFYIFVGLELNVSRSRTAEKDTHWQIEQIKARMRNGQVVRRHSNMFDVNV